MATVVDDGLLIKEKRLTGVDSIDPVTYMSLGSGSTAEATTDTELDTEITTDGGERAAATVEYIATGKSRWTKTFSFTGSLTIRELGLHNAATATSGDMYGRHVFPANISVVNGDSITFIAEDEEAR